MRPAKVSCTRQSGNTFHVNGCVDWFWTLNYQKWEDKWENSSPFSCISHFNYIHWKEALDFLQTPTRNLPSTIKVLVLTVWHVLGVKISLLSCATRTVWIIDVAVEIEDDKNSRKKTHARTHTLIPRQITWTSKPPAHGTFQRLPLMSRKFSVCVCVCVPALSVTTGPFMKVLALHLPRYLHCMLAAPGKT